MAFPARSAAYGVIFSCTLACSSSPSSGTQPAGDDSTGCSGGATTACTVDDTVTCLGGATGYSCSCDVAPESEDPTLACTAPGAGADGREAFCCFPWTFGDASCTPAELATPCPASTYGFQCVGGATPSQVTATLSCNAGVADPDGTHVDFCCGDD